MHEVVLGACIVVMLRGGCEFFNLAPGFADVVLNPKFRTDTDEVHYYILVGRILAVIRHTPNSVNESVGIGKKT